MTFVLSTAAPTPIPSETIIALLVSLVIGMVVYWRKTKDKADDALEAKLETYKESNRKMESQLYNKLEDNQRAIMLKIDEVLSGQHVMEVSISKAFSKIEQHSDKISVVLERQKKGLEDLADLEKKVAVNEEWKKRVEDKIDLR